MASKPNLAKLRTSIPRNTPVGQAGGFDMLLRVTGGNVAGAAVLAAISEAESSHGAKSGRYVNNAFGYGVHAGPGVYTSKSWEEGARKVWKALSGPEYRGKGYTTLPKIIQKYVTGADGNNMSAYTRNTSNRLRQYGIDPNADIWSGAPVASPQRAVPQAAAQPVAGGAYQGAAPKLQSNDKLNALIQRWMQQEDASLSKGSTKESPLFAQVLKGLKGLEVAEQVEGQLGTPGKAAKAPLSLARPGATPAPGGGGPTGAPFGSPIAGQKPQRSTHQTSGLPGYPAYDYMAPAGTRVGAPVSGTVMKLSGKDPRLGGAPGGPLGYSVYLKGSDGKTYFLTHIDQLRVKVGQKVKQGDQIAVVANGPKSWSSPHVHMGVHG